MCIQFKLKGKIMESGSKSPILFIVGTLLTVIFAFNNCGQGFLANNAASNSVGVVGTSFEKINVVRVLADGSHESFTSDYIVEGDQVFVSGMNVASTEELKPGDTHYIITPSNNQSEERQRATVSSLQFESAVKSGQTVSQALKFSSFGSNAMQTIREGLRRNRVLYIDNSTAWNDRIFAANGFVKKFNDEMDAYNINFKLEYNKKGRYPKVTYKAEPNQHGIAYRSSNTLFDGNPGVSIALDNYAANGGLDYHTFAQTIMVVIGFYAEHLRPGIQNYMGHNPDKVSKVNGVPMTRYNSISKNLSYNTSVPFDKDSVLVDSSHRFNELGGNFSSQPVIYNKATGEPFPVKESLSTADKNALTDIFGPKQPSNILNDESFYVEDIWQSSLRHFNRIFFKRSERAFNTTLTDMNHNLNVAQVGFCMPKSMTNPKIKLVRIYEKPDGSRGLIKIDPLSSTPGDLGLCDHGPKASNGNYKELGYFFSAPLVTNGEAPLNLLAETVDRNRSDQYFFELAEDSFVPGNENNPFFSMIKYRGGTDERLFPMVAFMRRFNSLHQYDYDAVGGSLTIFDYDNALRFFLKIPTRWANNLYEPESICENCFNICEISSAQLNSMLSSQSGVDSANIEQQVDDEDIVDTVASFNYPFTYYFKGSCSQADRDLGKHTLLTALGVDVGDAPPVIDVEPDPPVLDPEPVSSEESPISSNDITRVNGHPVCDGTQVAENDPHAWVNPTGGNAGYTCMLRCSDAVRAAIGDGDCVASPVQDNEPTETENENENPVTSSSFAVNSSTNNNSVTLTWSQVSGAAKYKVYRNGHFQTTVNGGLSFTEEVASGSYDYYVKAENSSNQEVGRSDSIVVTVGAQNTASEDDNTNADAVQTGIKGQTCGGDSGRICCVGHDDSDSDGWGYENSKSCILLPASGATNSDSASGSCVDTDGDGYGWNQENSETCYCNNSEKQPANIPPGKSAQACTH